ncbi:helix-turn-helix domain-containing protein [Clostridium sp.]|uniref:winged helix-turn-helix transcriptional regulator n=1 Tax=Clostridium sp. TaxID=1506 RepID=UPI001A63821B|nr:helix-turn-helix domain-containing protein [Clostridium sp.]MBK5237109.1 helix-turn-helix transcriptional regulator [Clostridium sp.]
MNQEVEVYSAPFEYTLSIFSGKWKMAIMFWLSRRKILRYGELKKCIIGITHKMLSSQLKELETYDIIVRTEYHQVPPKVEYFLSEKGLSLMPILEEMCSWGHMHYKDEISNLVE